MFDHVNMGYKIIVGNIPRWISDLDLRRHFMDYGPILETKLAMHFPSNTQNAILTFPTLKQAERALDRHHIKLDGVQIHVSLLKDKVFSSQNKNLNKRQLQHIGEVIKKIQSFFPKTFFDLSKEIPLKHGIYQEILSHTEVIEALKLNKTLLSRLLYVYTNRDGYQKALAKPFAMRIDLDGHICEPVLDEEKHRARARLVYVNYEATEKIRTIAPELTT
jgi:hypothetical protein